jgi:imidazolonepropionase-like amidohydrolase
MFIRVTLVLAGMSAVFVARAQLTPMQTVLLRDVRLIDGTGAPRREHVSLLLRNGRIEKIGETMVVPKGVQVRELSGKTVRPGLISAHSHLGLIVDDAESSATGYTRV